ncbi:hypothetical protein AX17_003180 [Amanita inopinata Kibby_2008]|nr:hypothetical protein AX17_003180 [Amanita inopinata Kibby_2008]
MAGALSGHILDTFNANQSMNIVTSGPMSFNPSNHGAQPFQVPFASYAFGTQNSFMSEDMSESTAKKIAALQVKLNQKLGPEYISQRPGPGGGPKLTYAEGWKIINLANEVFGFNGWSSSLVGVTTDFIDYNEESRRYTVGVTAIVRVTLRDGVSHEDIGYGMLENSKSKGAALDKCKKEAVTDGLKRALRNFGNLLGNCLYDKAYTQEVVKMKVTPPKFDVSGLHRRPECEDVKPNVILTSNIICPPNAKQNDARPNMIRSVSSPSYAPQQNQMKAPSSPPLHMQKEARSTGNNPTVTNTTSASRAPVSNQHVPMATVSMDNKALQGVKDNKAQQQANRPPAAQRERVVTFSNTVNANPNVNNRKPGGVQPLPKNSSNSFAKSEPSDSLEDEMFGCSQDDAFFASVDLGDIDLGRPIEDDMGWSIDFEDGLSTDSAPMSNITSLAPGDTRTTTNPSSAAPQKPGPAQQQEKRQRPQAGNPMTAYNSISRQDENMPPPRLDGRDSGDSRKAKPSVGGFQFPPGMNPFQRINRDLDPRIGVKRPAEALSTGYTSGRAIQNACSIGSRSGGREILGQLELDEGGDVKRIKR